MKTIGYILLGTLCALTLILANAKVHGANLTWLGVMSPILAPMGMFVIGGTVAALTTKEPTK